MSGWGETLSEAIGGLILLLKILIGVVVVLIIVIIVLIWKLVS
jgi:hypothetical protein